MAAESLHIFWPTWKISMKFTGKIWFMMILKDAYKRTGFNPLFRRYVFRKTTGGGVGTPQSFLVVSNYLTNRKISILTVPINNNNTKQTCWLWSCDLPSWIWWQLLKISKWWLKLFLFGLKYNDTLLTVYCKLQLFQWLITNKIFFLSPAEKREINKLLVLRK